MAKTPLAPAFEIPLSDADLLIIGRICVIWSHIELMTDVLLRDIHGIDQAQFDEFFRDKQMGHKLSALKRCGERPSVSQHKAVLDAYYDQLAPLLTDRNHVVHGLWGYRVNRTGRVREAAAHSHKRRETPFSSRRLKKLSDGLAAASCAADDLCIKILGYEPRPDGGRRFYFGAAAPQGCECIKCQQARLQAQP